MITKSISVASFYRKMLLFKMKSYQMKSNVVSQLTINGANAKAVTSFDGKSTTLIKKIISTGLYFWKIIEEMHCVKLRRRF